MGSLVSIITPNYNCARFITQTIESVLLQTYQNWEMLIIDDCSTDGSYEIACAYSKKDKRIKIFRMEQNSGAALCRNKAIELSNGDYLAFLDSDDLWLPEKLERQLKFMVENRCDFSFTEYEHIDEDGQSVGIKARVIKRLTYKKMLLHCFTGCLTVMYKQNMDNKIFGPAVASCNDWALFLKILQYTNNAMGYSDCLAKYRIRRNSLSRNKIKKIKPFFTVMVNFEHLNIFSAFFHLCIHQLIKLFWKYKALPYTRQKISSVMRIF
jgi:glycosyltransferase involved in cell wall biosynthesis